jgi:large subunit ribosomal protein L19
MQPIALIEAKNRKAKIAPVRSGDIVRIHQEIREGSRKRVQMFEGTVIRTRALGSLTARLTVRRIASGVGVEKTFLLHSPAVTKLEIVRRSAVKRNFLSYLRERQGKSARMREVSFDKAAANAHSEPTDEPVDREVTEIDAESAGDAIADTTTDEVAKSEDRAAADAELASDGDSQTDENLAPADEVETGVEKADEAA